MFKVNCLNKISPVGMANLTDNYTVTENFDEADIVLVRSAAMQPCMRCSSLQALRLSLVQVQA